MITFLYGVKFVSVRYLPNHWDTICLVLFVFFSLWIVYVAISSIKNQEYSVKESLGFLILFVVLTLFVIGYMHKVGMDEIREFSKVTVTEIGQIVEL